MKEICPNLHNKQVAKEFGELEQLFGKTAASLLWSRNNGYSIDKAPNGADSILFQSLLDITKNRQQALIEKAKIYSDNFLKWFGDWEKAANANRVSLGKEIPNTDEYSKYGQKGETDVEIREVLDEKGNVIGTVRMEFSGKNRNGVVTLHPNLTVTGKGYGTALYQHIADKYNINIEESFGEIGKSEAAKRMWNRIYNAISKDPDTHLRQLTPSNSSKVVDENGEPLVVYHNTPFEFNGIFDMDHKSRIMPWTSEPFGHVGTQETANKIKGTQFALFLNIKNPLETPDFVHETVNSMLSELYKQGIISKDKYSSLRGISNSELRNLMLSLGYDGTKYENKAERGGTSYSFIAPNQIKSATDNIGTFSRTNDDIRYREVPNSSFESLDTEMQENLLKKGWTAEKFDSISQEERNQAVKCIAFQSVG